MTNDRRPLQGVARLSIQAVIAITDLVESMHRTIATTGRRSAGTENIRTTGLTGLVYRNIRRITHVTGKSLDLSLSRLDTLLITNTPSPSQQAMHAALNGVMGDYLALKQNPLAMTMQFRQSGQPLDPGDLAGSSASPVTPVNLLIHGLCMHDGQWLRDGHDHGRALQRDLGITPVYLRYNTGLSIAENGRELDEQLETLTQTLPSTVPLNIIAHSMGGLVARSACHYAQKHRHHWLSQLQTMVFLGTPHYGAPLEKAGNWLETLMGKSPYVQPFSRLANRRSQGIKDLRHGTITDQPTTAGASGAAHPPVPLPPGVDCFAIAGTLSRHNHERGALWLGDGLVPVDSALGQHLDTDLNLGIPQQHKWLSADTGHLGLLSDPEVYQRLKRWLSPSA